MSMRPLTTLLLLALAGCAPPLGRADAGRTDAGLDDTPDAGSAADAGDVAPDAGPLHERTSCRLFCSETFQQCTRGECLDNCFADVEDPDSHCDADAYCHVENVCVPRKVRSCAESPCIDDQACVGGFCVQPTGIGCAGEDVNDDCLFIYVCDPLNGRCVIPPTCADDGTCPPGTLGAVCNGYGDAVLDPDMTEGICLLGQCRDDDDCPPSRRCEDADPDGGVTLGWCRPRPTP